MARATKAFTAKDGTVFISKVRAKQHDRKIKLLEEIEELPVSRAAKDHIRQNWADFVRMSKKYGNVLVAEDRA